MRLHRTGIFLGAFALLASTAATGCRRAIVVVPERRGGYTAKDTLWGVYRNKDVRITFRHVTTLRVDTVVRHDTLWRAGTRIITRVDTLVRHDTLWRTGSRVISRVDTLVRRDTIVRRDTLRLVRRDTIVRRDTLRLARRDTVVRRDTLRLVVRDTVWRVDTVQGPPRESPRRVDTLRIVVHDTVVRGEGEHDGDVDENENADTRRRGGPRRLAIPPGQAPPEGQCRIWIPRRPPGQQSPSAPCEQLGPIPAGAFILFGGEAWDFDYDWLSAPDGGGAPPEVLALKRRGGR